MGDLAALAQAYLAYHRTKRADLTWAWDALDAEGFHDPQTKWEQILETLRQARSPGEVAAVGAGPLETLIATSRFVALDLIERELPGNRKLVGALSNVFVGAETRDRDSLIEELERLLSLGASPG